MDINQKKRKEEEFFKSIYPVADDKIRAKTNAELGKKAFLMHFYFIRFAFALLSFALYLPTIIELFQTSFSPSDYIRNGIIILILVLLEIGLSFSLHDYYVRYHSENKDMRKLIVYALVFVSVVLSALSGVNAIDIVDHSEKDIISETRAAKDSDIKKYLAHIDSNQKKLDDADKRIANNNKNIKDLAPVSVTKKGSAQIKRYQAQNERNQDFIAQLTKQNNHLLKVIEDIRRESKSMMKNRITKAGKKEIIYMVIFFLSGIVAAGGLMFSYNYIGMYYRHVKDDAEHIAILKEQLDAEKEEQERMEQEKRIKQKELDKYERSLDEEEPKIVNLNEKKRYGK